MMHGTRKLGHASCRLGRPKALPQHMHGPIVELFRLRTDAAHRGKGEANRLLTSVCLEADLFAKLLFLHVDAEDGDHDRLHNFYARHGFQAIQTTPATLMVRMPLKATARVQ